MHVLWVALCVGTGGAAAADSQSTVTWPNGDRLSGTLVSNENGVITLSHTTLGSVRVAAKDVTLNANDDAQPTDASGSTADTGHATEATTDALGEDDQSAWTGSFSLAGSTSRADSTTSNVRVGAELRRESDAEKFDLTASWYWGESQGETTDNDLLVRASQYWYVQDSRWLYFAQGTWQYDQFQDWGHRVSPYGGIGYTIYDQEDLSLVVKAGAGATWKYHDHEVDPQVLLESTTDWKINDRQSLTGRLSIAPDPLDWGNYLATVQADWKCKLGSDTPWALSLGIRNIYDSRSNSGSSGNDLKAYVGLAVEF